MAKFVRQILLSMGLIFLPGVSLFAAENSWRYFPFSSRPEKNLNKQKSTLNVDFFYASGHNIAHDDKPALGIGEIFGRYDLQDIIFAMNEVGMPTSDVVQKIGSTFLDKPILFNVHGNIRAGGVALHYNFPLPVKIPMSLGVMVPFMRADSIVRYSLDLPKFAQEYYLANAYTNFQPIAPLDERIQDFYVERFDSARRQAHEIIGFRSNHWSSIGFGDVNCFVRSNLIFDHKFLMRSIDIAMQYGVTLPLGVKRTLDDIGSVPFGSDGHFGFYGQVSPVFELKEDLRLGFLLRGEHYLSETRERRLPVFRESPLYSPLVGRVTVKPGSTFIFNTFLILGNIYDGLHLQGRYTYKHHLADTWQDVRDSKVVSSYLSRTPTPAAGSRQAIGDQEIKNVISAKEYLSKFRSHYITIQLMYDPCETNQNLAATPKFYASFEAPVFDTSRGILQANQISIGAELHF